MRIKIGDDTYVEHTPGYEPAWRIIDLVAIDEVDLTDDEMAGLVKAWCEVNGLPFPWAGCVPEHNEIEAAKGQEYP